MRERSTSSLHFTLWVGSNSNRIFRILKHLSFICTYIALTQKRKPTVVYMCNGIVHFTWMIGLTENFIKDEFLLTVELHKRKGKVCSIYNDKSRERPLPRYMDWFCCTTCSFDSFEKVFLLKFFLCVNETSLNG